MGIQHTIASPFCEQIRSTLASSITTLDVAMAQEIKQMFSLGEHSALLSKCVSEEEEAVGCGGGKRRGLSELNGQ